MHSSVVGRIVEHRSGSESRVQSTRAPERCWGAKPCCGALHCGGAGDTGAFHIHTTGVPNGNSGHCGALERRVADRTESEVVDTLGRWNAGSQEEPFSTEVAMDNVYLAMYLYLYLAMFFDFLGLGGRAEI